MTSVSPRGVPVTAVPSGRAERGVPLQGEAEGALRGCPVCPQHLSAPSVEQLVLLTDLRLNVCFHPHSSNTVELKL